MNNILIDTIRISGFRGIKDIEISLFRVTLLIGINNSEKTSVLKAMQLALGDYHRFISDEDFVTSHYSQVAAAFFMKTDNG